MKPSHCAKSKGNALENQNQHKIKVSSLIGTVEQVKL
jgi:hypothetical protein